MKIIAKHASILFLLIFSTITQLNAQQITIKLKTGRLVTGDLISINKNELQVDPVGSVSLLRLGSNLIASLTLTKKNETFDFPITEEQVLYILNYRQKRTNNNSNSSYFEHYWGGYLFGGISSKKTLYTQNVSSGGINYLVDIIYKNKVVIGGGVEYLYDSRNNPVDLLVDAELALIGAEFLMNTEGINASLMTGTVLATDVNFNVFPFQARNVKYPAPFVFIGLGLRFIGFENASEFHAALPFGLGFRYQATKRMAIQLKEKFVYSTLDNVDNFILPETRIEIHFDISRW
jgi:hypothetical protein